MYSVGSVSRSASKYISIILLSFFYQNFRWERLKFEERERKRKNKLENFKLSLNRRKSFREELRVETQSVVVEEFEWESDLIDTDYSIDLNDESSSNAETSKEVVEEETYFEDAAEKSAKGISRRKTFTGFHEGTNDIRRSKTLARFDPIKFEEDKNEDKRSDDMKKVMILAEVLISLAKKQQDRYAQQKKKTRKIVRKIKKKRQDCLDFWNFKQREFKKFFYTGMHMNKKTTIFGVKYLNLFFYGRLLVFDICFLGLHMLPVAQITIPLLFELFFFITIIKADKKENLFTSRVVYIKLGFQSIALMFWLTMCLCSCLTISRVSINGLRSKEPYHLFPKELDEFLQWTAVLLIFFAVFFEFFHLFYKIYVNLYAWIIRKRRERRKRKSRVKEEYIGISSE